MTRHSYAGRPGYKLGRHRRLSLDRSASLETDLAACLKCKSRNPTRRGLAESCRQPSWRSVRFRRMSLAGYSWAGCSPISAAKRKNDTLDARTLADLLRCNLFPACYVPPVEYESLRCYLRERALLVRARVMFKNKTAGLLIQRGVLYETRKLHGKRKVSPIAESWRR